MPRVRTAKPRARSAPRRPLTRRRVLSALGLAPVAIAHAGSPAAGPGLAPGARSGPPLPFSFARLVDRARDLAAQPFRAAPEGASEVLDALDYDAYQKIRFDPRRALWPDGAGNFPVELFHLGRYFRLPVSINVVSGGFSHRIRYSADYFEHADAALAARLPRDLGFAGLRVMSARREENDWLVFLGAAYFRSAGALNQFGQSARGVAVDTGLAKPEEFPRFTDFYVEQGPAGSDTIVVYTLLDGPSVSGAFRFVCANRDGVVMNVECALFMRQHVERLGIAPLTSMYWFGEHDRHLATDWRPEVHDTDGLAIWTGNGERLWRPLNNPRRVTTNAFTDERPRGFGLQQRDRRFSSYEDDGVFYERRPSVWVEPLGDWGKGSVHLVEIPTDDEIYDNIVAFWVPAAPATAGSELRYRYRLHWLADEPYPPPVGRVRHTRTGRGGVPGRQRPEGVRKFVIDFGGGPLESLEKAGAVTPVVSTSRGRTSNAYALKVVGTRTWRAFFDLDVDGAEPVNLRCYLKLQDRALTETWLFQYLPPGHA